VHWTSTLKELTGRKGKSLFMPLRQALTAMDHGPEMKDLLPLIGYQNTKIRLEKAMMSL
jgi:glutamyl-tRNA synthetase